MIPAQPEEYHMTITIRIGSLPGCLDSINVPSDSSVADAFILDSTVGPEMLYYFGEHLDEAEAVGHMAPLQAARILTVLERSILHPEGEPEKKEPKPAAIPPKPAVVKTQAARPATDLKATQPAPLVSEKDAAILAGDFTRYKKIADLEDIEKRKRR